MNSDFLSVFFVNQVKLARDLLDPIVSTIPVDVNQAISFKTEISRQSSIDTLRVDGVYNDQKFFFEAPLHARVSTAKHDVDDLYEENIEDIDQHVDKRLKILQTKNYDRESVAESYEEYNDNIREISEVESDFYVSTPSSFSSSSSFSSNSSLETIRDDERDKETQFENEKFAKKERYRVEFRRNLELAAQMITNVLKQEGVIEDAVREWKTINWSKELNVESDGAWTAICYIFCRSGVVKNKGTMPLGREDFEKLFGIKKIHFTRNTCHLGDRVWRRSHINKRHLEFWGNSEYELVLD